MRRLGSIAVALLVLGAGGAQADSAGSGALALGALVGSHAPGLPGRDKRALASMLAGRLGFAFPRKRVIDVKAASVSCRSSDVDISTHSCTLKFGARTRTLNGRVAHELYATLVENGVASDGAAGSIFEAVSRLSCRISPAEVKQRGGGGAKCTWSAS